MLSWKGRNISQRKMRLAFDRGEKMKRKISDDPRHAEIANNVLRHMRRSLQTLASPAQAQLSHFPAGWIVLTT